MKKQSKWLLLGSLMCLGLGSVFQSSCGMFNGKEEKEETSEVQPKQTGLIDLPPEMLEYLMIFLTPDEIVNFAKTCKKLHEISIAEALWKNKAIECKLSENEMQKVQENSFTYKQIVISRSLLDISIGISLKR